MRIVKSVHPGWKLFEFIPVCSYSFKFNRFYVSKEDNICEKHYRNICIQARRNTHLVSAVNSTNERTIRCNNLKNKKLLKNKNSKFAKVLLIVVRR